MLAATPARLCFLYVPLAVGNAPSVVALGAARGTPLLFLALSLQESSMLFVAATLGAATARCAAWLFRGP